MPISHHAYHISAIIPISHYANQPSSPIMCLSVTWSEFATFKPFGLFCEQRVDKNPILTISVKIYENIYSPNDHKKNSSICAILDVCNNKIWTWTEFFIKLASNWILKFVSLDCQNYVRWSLWRIFNQAANLSKHN